MYSVTFWSSWQRRLKWKKRNRMEHNHFRKNRRNVKTYKSYILHFVFVTFAYQYRPPQAGDRVLVCIRPAGRCRSTRPSLTWAGLPCLSWARLVSKNVLKSTYPPQVWKHKKTENVQKCISRIESERSLPICCRMWSAKRRPEFAYLLRVFQTLKKANIDFFFYTTAACIIGSAKKRPELTYLLRVFKTLKKSNIENFSTQRYLP